MSARIRSLLLFATVAGVALGPWSEADAALHAYLRVKGQKQGPIEGSATAKGREKWIPVNAVNHDIAAPRDASSGLATGKRLHKPFVFTKELDRSSPLLYKALVTGETLSEVELVVFAAADKAAKTPLYSVKLINASIAEIRFVTPQDGAEAQEVSLTYQKIVWTAIDGAVLAEDDWDAADNKPQPAPKPMPMPKK